MHKFLFDPSLIAGHGLLLQIIEAQISITISENIPLFVHASFGLWELGQFRAMALNCTLQVPYRPRQGGNIMLLSYANQK